MESLSEFENKQYVKPSAAATRVKPEKFSGSGNDTDFQAFLDQFEACAKMNGWKEEEKANQLILCMKEKAHVVMSPLSASDKSSYTCMVEALRKKIGMRQLPEAAKATLKARRRMVGESLLDLSIDIKHLCGEAYLTLSSASLEQACVDHFTDAVGATIAKDIVRSKPSTLDKAVSEALELRAVRMRERVVSVVSTHEKEKPEEDWPHFEIESLPEDDQELKGERTIFILTLTEKLHKLLVKYSSWTAWLLKFKAYL